MQEAKNPMVTVILPTYNRVGLLDRAIASIFTQSFTNFELIVINDASTDNTRNYLDELAKKDPRVVPLHNAKNNYPDISKNLNEGLEMARGKYIARLDDDDYWCDNDKLKKQFEFLESHPEYVITGGGTIVIDNNDRERFRYQKLETDEKIRRRALFANPLTHSTVMFHRDAALAAGGYGNFKNVEDWDLWLRMGAKGKFYNFQEYFVRYLMNDNSKTVIFKHSQSKEILRVLWLHRNEYPNFFSAYVLNLGQYFFSLLPMSAQRKLYGTLSRAKRSL